jgi:hypothetical protein
MPAEVAAQGTTAPEYAYVPNGEMAVSMPALGWTLALVTAGR